MPSPSPTTSGSTTSSPQDYAGIVLDESSILKDLTGATRQALTEWVAKVPFRLAATATPAPNDLIELLSHAEWLGIMPWRTSAAMWMINDGKDIVEGWRLKGHAAADFWRWVRTWASIFRRPSDLGCPDPAGYDPPDYRTIEHFFDGALIGEADRLFAHGGLSELRRARKLSMSETVRRIAELVAAEPVEPWVIWCELNAEAEALANTIPGSVNLHGSMPEADKEAALIDFTDGCIGALVTKAGHRRARHELAALLEDGVVRHGLFSYERVYQAIRRCWRHGQQREVVVHVVGDRSAEHAFPGRAAKGRGGDADIRLGGSDGAHR